MNLILFSVHGVARNKVTCTVKVTCHTQLEVRVARTGYRTHVVIYWVLRRYMVTTMYVPSIVQKVIHCNEQLLEFYWLEREVLWNMLWQYGSYFFAFRRSIDCFK